MSRVTEIRYVGYGTPEFDEERTFYTKSWGLKDVTPAASSIGDDMAYFAAEGSDELYTVRLRRAAEKRIDVVALATDSRADVDALHERVVGAGCKIISAPHDLDNFGGGYGFRFFSADGLTFEVSSDVQRGTSRPMVRWDAVPQKISHIVFHSPDHKAMTAFFIDVLGFRLSDWLGDMMSFLRCNEWHHRIAFLPGPPCLNHVAYDMLTVDDMMRGIARLRKQGTDIRWGPGRHTAGNNTFSYFTTPSGFAVEYSSELESVDDATHEAKVHEPGPGVMDQWETGVGGPQTMPKPEADKGLFQAVAV
ncbi:MAG TPA: VOC family protein [Sphingomonas sp.]|jgi:catechol 2,3-dioxygenase-like lactoylglutathione lyase family enzyme